MDGYSISALINKQNIEISTIHLLTDKDKYIIAINWTEKNESHFKMFKQLQLSQVTDFSECLKSCWNESINDWLDGSKMPLKLVH